MMPIQTFYILQKSMLWTSANKFIQKQYLLKNMQFWSIHSKERRIPSLNKNSSLKSPGRFIISEEPSWSSIFKICEIFQRPAQRHKINQPTLPLPSRIPLSSKIQVLCLVIAKSAFWWRNLQDKYAKVARICPGVMRKLERLNSPICQRGKF